MTETKRAYISYDDVEEGIAILVTEPDINPTVELEIPDKILDTVIRDHGFIHAEENENGTIVDEEWVEFKSNQIRKIEEMREA